MIVMSRTPADNEDSRKTNKRIALMRNYENRHKVCVCA